MTALAYSQLAKQTKDIRAGLQIFTVSAMCLQRVIQDDGSVADHWSGQQYSSDHVRLQRWMALKAVGETQHKLRTTYHDLAAPGVQELEEWTKVSFVC